MNTRIFTGYQKLNSILYVCKKTPFSQELLGQSSPNPVCSICRVKGTTYFTFHDLHPNKRLYLGKKCKTYVFLQNLLLYFGTW